MVNSFWRLEVITEHSSNSLLGTEGILRQAIAEWRDWLEDGLDDNKAVLCVEGLYNSADRAECSILVQMSKIDSMTLVKM